MVSSFTKKLLENTPVLECSKDISLKLKIDNVLSAKERLG
jgi:hypothetical protein